MDGRSNHSGHRVIPQAFVKRRGDPRIGQRLRELRPSVQGPIDNKVNVLRGANWATRAHSHSADQCKRNMELMERDGDPSESFVEHLPLERDVTSPGKNLKDHRPTEAAHRASVWPSPQRPLGGAARGCGSSFAASVSSWGNSTRLGINQEPQLLFRGGKVTRLEPDLHTLAQCHHVDSPVGAVHSVVGRRIANAVLIGQLAADGFQ